MFKQTRKLILLYNLIKDTSLKELALIIGAKQEKIILIAKVELIKLEAILTEMKAENYQRQMQGLSIAYDDFSNVIQTADEIAESFNEKLDIKNTRYRKALEEIEDYCNQQNLKYDTTACEILNIINKARTDND